MDSNPAAHTGPLHSNQHMSRPIGINQWPFKWSRGGFGYKYNSLWRRKIRYSPISTVKHRIKSRHADASAAKKSEWLCCNYEWMDEATYSEIWETTVLLIRVLKLGRGWVFQHGNDPEQTVRATKELLHKNYFKVLSRPRHSADPNQMENIWRELKLFVPIQKPQNLKGLGKICMAEWAKIPAAACANLVNNYTICLSPLTKVLVIFFIVLYIYL